MQQVVICFSDHGVYLLNFGSNLGHLVLQPHELELEHLPGRTGWVRLWMEQAAAATRPEPARLYATCVLGDHLVGST